jgi:hypothetical protein
VIQAQATHQITADELLDVALGENGS